MDKLIEDDFGKTKEQLKKEISDYEDKIFFPSNIHILNLDFLM